jgi:DNA-directed RNA polymerase specialized sigma24 family protein
MEDEYAETVELGELLPGNWGGAAWDGMDVEVKQAHLASLFAKMSREQRQAFVLNVVDGFNVAEIADFQGRKVAAVQADIAAATTNVQRQLQLEESPDAEEPFARRELRQFRRKNH